MFSRVLIANRGEIACRVIRSCRRLGIHAIAVYSDADAHARHVREADSAVRIGAAPARDSYLNADAILAAALASGAEAIHPGYGFLSEKLQLIDACAAAGVTFIGPHREAILRMGSKIESKRLARGAGVACVPGYDGDDQSDARLGREAAALGYPLLIKASAGGGGKGLRRVDSAEQFHVQLATARAEAEAAFGDRKVLLERCIRRPRHLEVQLLGDRHGGLVHLFERECSIQRNYQKVIEEAPAHHLSDAVRERLFAAALALGRAIGYDSAGTVEFVLDAERDDEPYFLEMNTRLQVEHPVTEMTTGVDLVEAQIRSAFGERLPLRQDAVSRSGWAIEARVNAEVPDRDYQASCGPLLGYSEPTLAGLRIDSGIDELSEVTPHYDSLLAKLIAHGGTRAAALERLRNGLRGLRIEGLETNQAWLCALLGLPAFDEVLTTGFVTDAYPDGWLPPATLAIERLGAAGAAWFFARVARGASDRPLDAGNGLRLTAAAGRVATCTVEVTVGDIHRAVALDCLGATHLRWRVDDEQFDFQAEQGGTTLRCGARTYRVRHDGDTVMLWCDGHWSRADVRSAVRARATATASDHGADEVSAALPGIVTGLMVEVGQRVTAGMPVAILEAMKLVHTLCAPRDGVVASLSVAVGDTIQGGAVLIRLADVAD